MNGTGAGSHTIGIYTIGQGPRPDLTNDLGEKLGSSSLSLRGALDDLDPRRIPPCAADGYPLETLLRDGSRVVVDAGFVEPHLQRAIARQDDRVSAHLVLCAGPFSLAARRPIIQPFEAAVARLASNGLRSLEIVVPFADQATPATRKWQTAGFSCRALALDERPADLPVARWLIDRLAGSSADALVHDYVGARPVVLERVAGQLGIPVVDLGQLAVDTLAETLKKLPADGRNARQVTGRLR